MMSLFLALKNFPKIYSSGIPLEIENGSLRVCLVHTLGVLVANLPSAFHPFKYGCGGEKSPFLAFYLAFREKSPFLLFLSCFLLKVLVEATA